MQDSRERVLAYLNTNRLRHLVHLKYLHLYADAVSCVYVEREASVGVLLSYPTTAVFWDAQLYPQTEMVFLAAASDERGAELLATHAAESFPLESSAVFKF